MSKQYDNTNRGVLFQNDRKETDNHPDFTGTINIEGTDYWLNAWTKQRQSGGEYYSLSVKKKDVQGQARKAHKAVDSQRETTSDGAAEDDVPF